MRIVNLCYQALHNKNFPEYLKLNFAPKKNVCYEHAMIMVRWLKFQGTKTPSLREQLICLTNFIIIIIISSSSSSSSRSSSSSSITIIIIIIINNNILQQSNNRTRGQFECDVTWFGFCFGFVRSHARCDCCSIVCLRFQVVQIKQVDCKMSNKNVNNYEFLDNCTHKSIKPRKSR